MNDIEATNVTDIARRKDLRYFHNVMLCLAFVTVVAGFVLGLFYDRLHLSSDEARDVATLFLLVGVADTLVLYYWDRLFHGHAFERAA